MKTNVLFLYPSTYLAPSWTICAQIGRHLDSDRFGKFAAMDVGAVADVGFGAAHGANVERYSLGTSLDRARRRDARAAATAAGEIARLVRDTRRNKIDVIHASDDGTSMTLALAVARASGAKLLIHYHTIPTMYAGARLGFTRVVAGLAALNVGVSRFVAEDVRSIGVDPAKIAYVHNGTDPERYNPRIDGKRLRKEYGIADEEVLALQLARIWQPKRQIDFVRALGIARRKAPKLRGLIVGWEDPRYTGSYGSYSEELRAVAKEEGLGDGLILAKARPEAPELHAAADIAVLPSVKEPFGLVVVEAMATERPVIGARSGGIVEIIDDGVTGYLVAPESPDQIAARLVELAHDAKLRARIGAAARKRVVDYYGEARVAEQFGPVYEAVARGERVPPFAQL